jgi:hypothetical protein
MRWYVLPSSRFQIRCSISCRDRLVRAKQMRVYFSLDMDCRINYYCGNFDAVCIGETAFNYRHLSRSHPVHVFESDPEPNFENKHSSGRDLASRKFYHRFSEASTASNPDQTTSRHSTVRRNHPPSVSRAAGPGSKNNNNQQLEE